LESSLTAISSDERSGDEAPSEFSQIGPVIIADDKVDDEASGHEVGERSTPPHEDNFALHGHATSAQLDLAAQLYSSITLPPTTPPRVGQLKSAADDALTNAQSMLAELVDMARERDEWWRMKLRAEHERQSVWEESLKAVAREGEMLESELRTRSRRRSRMVDGLLSPDGTVRHRPVALPSEGVPQDQEGTAAVVEGLPAFVTSPVSSPTLEDVPKSPGLIRSTGSLTPTASKRFSLAMAMSPDEEGDTDEEDEFFDAIEANALPNLVITQPLAKGGVHSEPSSSVEDHRQEYAPYENLRTRLAITSDDRPPMSLWAVLKNSIGKDLTKISFPVFFNEPTSMLQRMAEDMEFTECRECSWSHFSKFSLMRSPYSGCRRRRKRPSTSDSFRCCVRHVQLLLNYRPNREAFQPYAGESYSESINVKKSDQVS
jgi:hypothetical protein